MGVPPQDSTLWSPTALTQALCISSVTFATLFWGWCQTCLKFLGTGMTGVSYCIQLKEIYFVSLNYTP